MRTRLLTAVMAVAVPACADPRQFAGIHQRQVVRIVLPNAQCDAKVVSRTPDQLTLALRKTTSACGKRNALVSVSRTDVENVIDEKPSRQERRDELQTGIPSAAGVCTIIGATLVAGTAGLAVGELKGDGPAIAVTAGGAAISAVICYGFLSRSRPRYSVFTSRITATATVP